MSSKSNNSTAVVEMTMIDEYFAILKKYKSQYNNTKVALLYQCGSFYELYGLKSVTAAASETYEENPDLEDISLVCGLAVSMKKHQLRGKAVFMAGVRDYVVEKYLAMLNDAGYTSIIYSQHRDGAKFVRKLDSIVSRGTYITYETDTTAAHSNNIMCIWMERLKQQLLIGVSTANIFTGKSYFFEFVTDYSMSPTNFDEIERQISTHSPNELIFVSNLSEAEIKDVLRFSGVKCSLIHYIDLTTNEKAWNCTKQQYIKHVFATYFSEVGGCDIVDTCSEFMTNLIATQAFCYLLNFIYEHNPNLLKNVSLPLIHNTSTRLILGNQTLRQLNLIDDGSLDSKRAGKYSSVLNFLNCTCTPMGRRAFSQQFVNPTFDEEWLEREYSMMELVSAGGGEAAETLRDELLGMKDMEKMTRQIALRKIYPCSIWQLYYSIVIFQRINNVIKSDMPSFATELYSYCLGGESADISQFCDTMLNFFHENFCIEKCKTISTVSAFEENFIREGVFADLDIIDKRYTDTIATFHRIHEFLNKLVQQSEEGVVSGGFAAAATGDFVKIHETEKSGCSLQITKRRALLLKEILGKQASVSEAEKQGIEIADIKFSAAGSGTNEEIHSAQIREITKNMIVLKEQRNRLIAAAYVNLLDVLNEKYNKTIQSLCYFVAKLDVLLAKIHVAKKYNYCRPIIDSSAEKSFIRAHGMRHVLIEHIQTKEIYVPNDIMIGRGGEAPENGMLIYGVNTTGKTSYIRSVGIAIVMAQAGMYVPCTDFVYKPYTAIFSRILGNDNLFHGLSTFAVEMSELRVILKMADQNTLVIGDEVCSGTETQSAISIFATALLELNAKKCSFLFATHFHEILECDEIRELCGGGAAPAEMKIAHMAVMYDREKDALIYERKLRDGAGYRMYGIEICKSLHLPDDFIEKAHRFRNKYYAETAGALSHKPSIYNTSKIRGLCEKCGIRMSEETHHVFPQKSADPVTGIISAENGATFHKNHLGNLMGLCEKCHKQIHTAGSNEAVNQSSTSPQQKKRIIRKTKSSSVKNSPDILVT